MKGNTNALEMRSRLNWIVAKRKERLRNMVAERKAEILRRVRQNMSVLLKTTTEQRINPSTSYPGPRSTQTTSPESITSTLRKGHAVDLASLTKTTYEEQNQKSPPESAKPCVLLTEKPKAKIRTTRKGKSRSPRGMKFLLEMDMQMVTEKFQPDDWLEYVHMSKDSFDELCEKLQPELVSIFPPLEKQVALTLVRLATGRNVMTLAIQFQLTARKVKHIVREVCVAIVTVLKPLYMQRLGKQNAELLTENADQFNTLWGFPHCVGVLGSLHIPARPKRRDLAFVNSQGWNSVVLQVVVNKDGRFWDVSAGLPGGMADCYVLQQSELWAEAEQGLLSPQPSPSLLDQPLGYVLLGKPTYPLRTWLLKSYPESPALTAEQRAFNTQLSRSQSPMQSALLRLKARWQCLHGRNGQLFDFLPTIIQACCILHNMCEVNGDPLKSQWLEQTGRNFHRLQPNAAATLGQDEAAAERVRSLLSQVIYQKALLEEPPEDPIMQEPPGDPIMQTEAEAQTEGHTLLQELPGDPIMQTKAEAQTEGHTLLQEPPGDHIMQEPPENPIMQTEAQTERHTKTSECTVVSLPALLCSTLPTLLCSPLPALVPPALPALAPPALPALAPPALPALAPPALPALVPPALPGKRSALRPLLPKPPCSGVDSSEILVELFSL